MVCFLGVFAGFAAWVRASVPSIDMDLILLSFYLCNPYILSILHLQPLLLLTYLLLSLSDLPLHLFPLNFLLLLSFLQLGDLLLKLGFLPFVVFDQIPVQGFLIDISSLIFLLFFGLLA